MPSAVPNSGHLPLPSATPQCRWVQCLRGPAKAWGLPLGEKRGASSTRVTCRGQRAPALVRAFTQLCLLKHICRVPSQPQRLEAGVPRPQAGSWGKKRRRQADEQEHVRSVSGLWSY